MTDKKITILRIAVPTPLRQMFDYLPPAGPLAENLLPGVRVRIPFQNRELIGVLIEVVSEVPAFHLREALEILDQEPVIPADILQLCLWSAQYYHHPVGLVLETALPVLLRQGKPLTGEIEYAQVAPTETLTQHSLNAAQTDAVKAIIADLNTFQVFLLDGVTGSGKTEIYLQVIDQVIKAQRQVLVLVPEIGLTPQTIQRFRQRFGVPVIALHSNLTQKKRLSAWRAGLTAGAKIIIGTRSAIFSPFVDLGLIIVDEEHDVSFKQQDGFRYHARDLAILRSQARQVPIILGSATPALETIHRAVRGNYKYLMLPERAGIAQAVRYAVVDVRNQYLEEGLSPALLTAMHEHLQNGAQVM